MARKLNSNRDVANLLRRAERAGCSLERTGSDHLKITLPDGSLYFAGTSTSDRKAVMRIRADLRRRGVSL